MDAIPRRLCGRPVLCPRSRAVCARQGWSKLNPAEWERIASEAGLEAERLVCRLRGFNLNPSAYMSLWSSPVAEQISNYLQVWGNPRAAIRRRCRKARSRRGPDHGSGQDGFARRRPRCFSGKFLVSGACPPGLLCHIMWIFIASYGISLDPVAEWARRTRSFCLRPFCHRLAAHPEDMSMEQRAGDRALTNQGWSKRPASPPASRI